MTSDLITTSQTESKKSFIDKIWLEITDHQIFFSAIAGGLCILLLSAMYCCHRFRKTHYMPRVVSEAIDIPLKQGLLENDSLGKEAEVKKAKGTLVYKDSAE